MKPQTKKNRKGKAKKQEPPTRIGKPQKSRKHRKIKATESYDPDQALKYRKSDVINRKPVKEDFQEMPRSLLEMMHGQEKVKTLTGKKKKKKKPKVEEIPEGMTRPVKPVPKFKQRINESERAFLHRVDQETDAVIAKTQLEDKYKVELDVMANGEVAVKKKRKRKNAKVRLQKLADKKAKKKRMDDGPDFSQFKDEVKFGEVAMAPPTLSTKPRKSEDSGKKDNSGLLLSGMLDTKKPAITMATREAGQTVKRKHLTPLQQLQHDRARDTAIQRYRELKAKKMKPLPD